MNNLLSIPVLIGNIGDSLFNFGITFVLLILVLFIFLTIGRHISKVTTIFLYIFVCSLLTIVISNGWLLKIEAFSIGYTLHNFLIGFTYLFYALYGAFTNIILFLIDKINVEQVSTFFINLLSNYIFVACFHGVLFLLVAIIFRKRRKDDDESSEYDD